MRFCIDRSKAVTPEVFTFAIFACYDVFLVLYSVFVLVNISGLSVRFVRTLTGLNPQCNFALTVQGGDPGNID